MLKIRFFDPADQLQPQKTTYQITNWSEYNQALIQRGRLTLWLDEDTITNWYYKGLNRPGGLYRYSDTCIQCGLSLKSVLKLAFRQTQGLMQSLIESMKLPLTEMVGFIGTQTCLTSQGHAAQEHSKNTSKVRRRFQSRSPQNADQWSDCGLRC